MNPLHYNLITDTDSYKASHWVQYPPGTTGMYSYFESRGGVYPETVFFGLQYYLMEYLSRRIDHKDVMEAKEFFADHGEPFNADAWLRIAKGLEGRLPVRIKAVPEGTVTPLHLPLMTVESTHPDFFWVVSWLETILSRIWYPITVATQSYHIKKLIKGYLEKTCDDPAAELPFKLHDFGSRGVSSAESAGIGGAAHLVNFKGSDTVQGVRFANHYYQEPMAGFSIPASEHSTITMWGSGAYEGAAFENMVTQFGKPGKMFACVIDSWDLLNAVDRWADTLRHDVAESGAIVVLRPDSGNPPEMVLAVLQRLEQKLKFSTTSKGYKLLPPYFRVIQGDGINHDSIDLILKTITDAGYCASNVAFGMGGALLQQVNRDTQKFAYKCSSATIKGQTIDVYKHPITDPGKASKKGRVSLRFCDGAYQATPTDVGTDLLLETVFENGTLIKRQTFADIRARAEQGVRLV